MERGDAGAGGPGGPGRRLGAALSTWPRRAAALVGSAFVTWLIATFVVPLFDDLAQEAGVARAPVVAQVQANRAALPADAVPFPPELVTERPIARVGPPPDGGDTARQAERWTWGRGFGAIDAFQSFVRATITGASGDAVVLQSLQVRVLERRPPLAGTYLSYEGLGSGVTPRQLIVRLDQEPPTVETQEGPGFPLRVSSDDVEVIDVIATTGECDCDWVVEIPWTAGDRSGVLRLDDGGRPFRTAATAPSPRYVWDGTAWTPAR